MKTLSLKDELQNNPYPGRGIIAGKSADGKYAVSAYWTMGRSAGSRNRVFVTDGEGIRTQAFDSSLIAGDPSLIIYAAVRVLGKKLIVTNGDQTDTILTDLKTDLPSNSHSAAENTNTMHQTILRASQAFLQQKTAPCTMPFRSSKATPETRTARNASPTRMKIRRTATEDLFTLTPAMEIRFRALKENQN